MTLPPEAPYFSAFSIRFSNSRNSSSRSPAITTGVSGRSMSIATWRSRASGSSPSTTCRMIGTISTSVSGRTWADSSTRDSDNRSSISRAIRVAWACMMPRKALARLGVVLGRPLQRIDEARQRRQRRAQFMAGIGDEVGAHFLDPAQRRLIVERHQHAFFGAAEQRRHRHRRDDQFHPAIDRHVIEIGGAPGFRGGDGLAQRGDDLGRAQRELGEFVLAQRRRELRRRRVEVNDAAGAVEQHRGIRHAGDDGADRGGFDRACDAADIFAGRGDVVQPPRHQRGGGDAGENRAGAEQRQFAEHDQHGEREAGGEQDDGRMPQPVRPRREEGRRGGASIAIGPAVSPFGSSNRQAPVSPRSLT